MLDVITIGSAVQDTFGEVTAGQVLLDLARRRCLSFELDDKVPVERLHRKFGGSAINAAMVFRRLGCQVAPLAQVGRDSVGQNLIRYLDGAGIDVSLMREKPDMSTGVSFAVHDIKEGEHITFNYKGASDNLGLTKRGLPPASWLYVGALTGESWQDDIDYLAKQAKKTLVAWNPGKSQIEEPEVCRALLEQVEILILNHAEAVQFLQMDAQENCRDMGSILGKLNKLGPRCVTVTAGQQGAYFSNGAHNYLISPVRFKSIDTTGTGDAFGATLVAGLIQQRDELTALKMAAINAGAVTREWGAHQGLMNLEEIEVMLDKAVVEEV